MNQWELMDCLEPLDEGEDNPGILIDSEARLRNELHRLQRRKPAHVVLRSPEQDCLSIGIGGPFASIGWLPPPEDRRSRGQKEAVADRAHASESVQFWGEGIPAAVDPDLLFPVAQAIEAIVFFYKEQRLPEWISWREWCPAEQRWTLQPAKSASERVSAS